jgi:hypothetical protein
MLEKTTRENLVKGLDSLRRELSKRSEKLKELETLKAEFEQISFQIKQIETFLGMESPAAPNDDKPKPLIGVAQPISHLILEVPIKRGIDEIYKQSNRRRLSISALVNGFREKGWKLSEKNPKEVIRSCLKRNPKEYRKVGRGIWERVEKNN